MTINSLGLREHASMSTNLQYNWPIKHREVQRVTGAIKRLFLGEAVTANDKGSLHRKNYDVKQNL